MALQKNKKEMAVSDGYGQSEHAKRERRTKKLPDMMDDPGWPAFPVPTDWNSGLASDVKYNHELIKVKQQTLSKTLNELAGLTNRTEQAIERADQLTWDLLRNVRNLYVGQNETRKQPKKLSYEVDGMAIFQSMIPVVLEDKLGEILYLQSLIKQAFVFRKGIQHLTRGQLTMDLILREYLRNAVSEVNKYLQQTYSRFHVAFVNPSFYYENSQPLFNYDNLKRELTVYVRVPVVADEHLFRIYGVLTFPVHIMVQGREKKDALQIINLPKSLAMSMSRQYYVPLTSSSWSGYYGQSITLCKDLPYMKKDHG